MYLIIKDSDKTYCTFISKEVLSEDDVDNCINIGDYQIIDMSNNKYLVDYNEKERILVWQKIPEK